MSASSSKGSSFVTALGASLSLVVVLVAGCKNEGAHGAGSAAPQASPGMAALPPATPSGAAGLPQSPVSPPSPGAAAVDDELSTRPMELLRFRFTSGIEGREPKDELDHARPGQRVYAYLALRNRTGRARTVTLAWKVNGEARTTTELNVDESWQFRTWGYNTVLGKDTKGTVELEVTDDAGHVVVEKAIPIRP